MDWFKKRSLYTESNQIIERTYKDHTAHLYYNKKTGHMYFDPLPSDELLKEFYSESFMRGESDPTPDTEFTENIINVASGVINYMNTFQAREKWKVFDVGCGYGGLVFGFQRLGHDAYGNELNPKWVQESNKFCSDNIYFGEIDDIEIVKNESFDLFHISHVLEHVTNPKRILQTARRALAENGLVYVNTPNSKSLRFAAYGRESGIDFGNFPMHLNFFTPMSMKELGEAAGLKLIKMETRPFDEIEQQSQVVHSDFRFHKKLLGGELFALFVSADSKLAHELDVQELYETIETAHKLFPIKSW
jgi:2-polyprenyl-3-methyl-5-hydroxy-6-metoxy-1,4-benzoquinol methylase